MSNCSDERGYYLVPDGVVVRKVKNELVILNQATEEYLGLDSIGLRFWELLTTSSSIEDAVLEAVREFDASEEVLHRDMVDLAGKLVGAGLLAPRAE